MTPKETLIAARALIAEPEHWTQGAYAKTARGNPIGPMEDNAFYFCAFGAIHRAAAGCFMHKTGAVDLLELGLLRPSDIIIFNDRHSHSEVLALFDAAIERAPA